MDEIVEALEEEFTDPPADIVPEINEDASEVGAFVSEYMAYHVVWYQAHINAEHPTDPSKQCKAAGHTHVGIEVDVSDAETAVDIQLEKLFEFLDEE